MAQQGKRYQAAAAKLEPGATLPLKDALEKIKEVASAKFDESIDIDANLGIDPTKGEQVVRGTVTLPHGTGKKVKVLVFAKGEYAEKAQNFGADYVGLEDLIEKIKKGWLEFDYAVATPDVMAAVGKIAKILGPRGLLPNKKVGTVTFDLGVVEELKKGRKFFRNDKGASVHMSIGRKSFELDKLHDNALAFLKALSSSKPATSKGKFVKKITVTSTMGPGVSIDMSDV